MVETSALEELIRTRRAAADRIERDVRRLQRDLQNISIEIDAYEKALLLINPLAATQQRLPLELSGQESWPNSRSRTGARQARSLSPQWKGILSTVAKEFPNSFGYSELLLVCEVLGDGLSRNGVRSQMMAYVNAGIAERISNGQFRITQEGLNQLGIAPVEAKEAPAEHAEASQECGDVAERSNASDYESEEPNTVDAGKAQAVQGSVGSNPTVSAPLRRELMSSSSSKPIYQPQVFPDRK